MVRPRRRFAQHFLTNPRVLDRIAAALDPAPGDAVLEIGPGKGTLTAALLRRGARVTAIEIDRDLARDLRAGFPALRVVEGDALRLDWHALMADQAGPWLLTGNIPYNITSPLLEKALTPPRPARIVFLVQREVADRVTARHATSAYGALTIGVQSAAQAERLFTVPRGAFHPAPRVDSAVIRLVPRTTPLVAERDAAAFRRFVTGVFSFRRKQIGRGLRELTGWSPERVEGILRGADIAPTVRPETLAPAAFAALLGAVIDAGWEGS
jgi:16S rRNA (adenine1518-N6/adenine1519-N6)-dimethyltransferase